MGRLHPYDYRQRSLQTFLARDLREIDWIHHEHRPFQLWIPTRSSLHHVRLLHPSCPFRAHKHRRQNDAEGVAKHCAGRTTGYSVSQSFDEPSVSTSIHSDIVGEFDNAEGTP